MGNLGKEVSDDVLARAFASRYPSFQKARAVRAASGLQEHKGYGFVQFGELADCTKALKEARGWGGELNWGLESELNWVALALALLTRF